MTTDVLTLDGATPLRGTVTISGAKNAALKFQTASLLTESPIRLFRYPSSLLDIQVHEGMLQALGKAVDAPGEDMVTITEPAPLRTRLTWDGRSIRNTLLMLGCLTTRCGEGRVPLPGGCRLGERKYDLHVQVLEQLGARVWEEEDDLCAAAPGGLTGTDIHLPLRSTGATENGILCGTLARGITRIWNPHIRPEILDLIRLLKAMGATIRVFGQERVEIEGVERLGGADHQVIPDSVEALTWMIAAAITDGDLDLRHVPFDDLEIPLIYLRESGLRFYRGGDSMIVRGSSCYPLEISTGPYPGINSDMQPLLAVFGAHAAGESRIVDLRFPGRYAYVDELFKMGLRSTVQDNLLRIHGGGRLHGATVRALDLRAGIALVLAGLAAEGTTVIHDAWQIHRGYHNLIPKLRGVGAHVH